MVCGNADLAKTLHVKLHISEKNIWNLICLPIYHSQIIRRTPDRSDKNKLWKISLERGIPQHLVQSIQNRYIDINTTTETAH